MNMQNIMAQAQKMEREIKTKQEEIYNMTFIGESEWCKVKMNGKREISKIEITYSGNIDEDRDMLSDMITIAINDGFKKIAQEFDKKLGIYSKQLGGLM